MQLNPLFVHRDGDVVVTVPIQEIVVRRYTGPGKLCFFLCCPYFLINAIAVLVCYLITHSFSDWFMIFCVVNTCIGGVGLVAFCCWECCFTPQIDQESPLP